MRLIIVIVHVFVCIALIMIVLLQKGKGADMGAAFGGSSQTLFGSGGATTFMHKLTTIVAIVFMLTSLFLSFFSGKAPSTSIMEDVTQTEVPAAETSGLPAQSGDAQD